MEENCLGTLEIRELSSARLEDQIKELEKRVAALTEIANLAPGAALIETLEIKDGGTINYRSNSDAQVTIIVRPHD